jgi:hypothetical protein
MSSTPMSRFITVACQVLIREYPTSRPNMIRAGSSIWSAMTPEQKMTWETQEIGYLPPRLAARVEGDVIVRPQKFSL